MVPILKHATPGLWLFLLSLGVTYFPYRFILHRYKKERTDLPNDWTFLFLYFLQMAWFFVNVILEIVLVMFFVNHDPSQLRAAFSIFFPSTLVVSALFSAITGVYPVMEPTGFFCYQNYKSSLEQIYVTNSKAQLKRVGWLQLILMTVLIGVSLTYVLE